MTESTPAPTTTSLDRRDVLAWSIGIIAGVAVAGGTFGGDLLLNWDQVIGPTVPVPPGLWGEGPQLPRRVPFYVPVALLSRLIPGPTVVGLILVGAVASAVVGTHRLVGRGRLGIILGLIYGLSPFLLSRAAVGHLPLVVATALLPWALPALRAGDRLTVFRWGLAFALTGSSGAVLGLVPATIAIMHRRRTVLPVVRDLLVLGATQACWVIPGVLVVTTGAGTFPSADIGSFDAVIDGVGGLSRLVVGGGLFIVGEDVAARAAIPATLLGLAILMLGATGLRRAKTWDTTVVAGVVGLGLIMAPLLPGVSSLWDAVIGIGPLALLRESQKFWPLPFLALLVGAAHQVRFLERSATATGVSLVLITLGILSAWPGLFGADGRLVADDASADFEHLADVLSKTEGRVLVLPWRRYEPLTLSDGRTVLQPAPWLFPSSADFIIGDGDGAGSEQPSDQARELAEIDQMVRSGKRIFANLSSLGIDFVLVEGSDDADYYRRLGSEDSIDTIIDADQLLLFEIDRPVTTIDDASNSPTRSIVRWIEPLTLLVTAGCSLWLSPWGLRAAPNRLLHRKGGASLRRP